MSSKNLYCFRFPDDLREAIDNLTTETGKDRTAVVMQLLRSGLEVYNDSNTTVKQNPEQLQETIESVVENKMQSVVNNLNNILAEMQSKVREVEERLGE